MFLRRCKRKKNGKQHIYWALVESYRTARGSRKRVVAYLGELKSNEQNGWAQLGQRLDKKSRPQPSLFDPPYYDGPVDETSRFGRCPANIAGRIFQNQKRRRCFAHPYKEWPAKENGSDSLRNNTRRGTEGIAEQIGFNPATTATPNR